MKVRTFKVMEPGFTDRGAHIRFRGNWLVDAGFAPGSIFTLTNPEPGVITLTVSRQEEEARAAFSSALQRFTEAGI